MNLKLLLVIAFLLQRGAGPIPTTSTASIEGTVRLENNIPAAASLVELQRVDPPVSPLYAVQTNTTGQFVLANLPPGRYRLFGSRPGYLRAENGQRQSRGAGAILILNSGDRIKADLNLTRSAAISGRITDATGRAVGTAFVEVVREGFQGGNPVLNVVQTGRTNDLGEYRLFGLSQGSYFVRATMPSGPNTGVEITNIDGTDPFTVGERIVDRPVLSRGLINLAGENEVFAPFFYPGSTDRKEASPIELQAGGDVRGINISVAFVRAYRIKAFVVDESGSVVRAAQLRVSTATQGAGIMQDAATGSFTTGRLTPGEYTLTATAGAKSGRIRFSIRNSDLELKVPVMAGFTLSGHLTVEGPDTGINVSALRVGLQPDPPVPGAFPRTFAVAANGSFTLTDVPVGDYSVTVPPISAGGFPGARGAPAATDPTRNAYIKAVSLGDTDVLNSRLRLDGPPNQSLEIKIHSSGGVVQGRALNDKGEPAVNVTAVLVPAAPDARPQLYKSGKTDAKGDFRFDRIFPGNYLLLAWEDVTEGAWLNSGFMDNYRERGKVIVMADGATAQEQIRVIPASAP